MQDAAYWIDHLGLVRHPEGGWFRETYRATETVPAAGLPARFNGPRTMATAIYFLLEHGDISALHRIRSDELWHFHAGASLTVHAIAPSGEYRSLRLGSDPAQGESFQGVVPAGSWFGAEVTEPGGYALVGCTVAPGFEFEDFEMGEMAALLAAFPAQEALIRRLTRAAL